MKIKSVGTFFKKIGSLGKKIMPKTENAVDNATQVVAEQEAGFTTKAVRKGTIERYLKEPITTMPDKSLEPYISESIMAEITEGNNIGARVICYPARTVVDMSKKDGSFVRKVFSPNGAVVKKEMKINADGSTKSVMPKSANVGKSVARDAEGEITRTKDWTCRNSEKMSHKKFFEEGKQIGGETSVKKPLGYTNSRGEFVEYATRENVTQYNIPAHRQASYTIQHNDTGTVEISPKAIDVLSSKTTDFLAK